MPEGSKHAAVLIAVSYQALNRALREKIDTRLSNCTVLILFGSFYVEATLNHILEFIGKDISKFPINEQSHNVKKFPGLQDKLAFFYNEFIENPKAKHWKELKSKNIYQEINGIFPGFSELYRFRNDLSHGCINDSANSLETAKHLRQQAKDLVNKLYDIAEENGYKVPRLITYQDAIASITNEQITFSTFASS